VQYSKAGRLSKSLLLGLGYQGERHHCNQWSHLQSYFWGCKFHKRNLEQGHWHHWHHWHQVDLEHHWNQVDQVGLGHPLDLELQRMIVHSFLGRLEHQGHLAGLELREHREHHTQTNLAGLEGL